MKYRFATILALCVVLGACFLTLLSSPRPASVPPMIRFVGFTNAVLGPKEPILTMPGAWHQAALKRWFAAGTNAVIFTISNRESRALIVSSHGLIRNHEGNRDAEMGFLLQPARGLLLSPRQQATIQVAFPPQRGPWKLCLFLSRDSREHTIADVVRGIQRALSSRRANSTSPVDSEWITSLPAGQGLKEAE